jgi:hypothetical protein
MSRDVMGRHIAEIIARLRPWLSGITAELQRGKLPSFLGRPIKWHTVAYRN